MAENQMVKPQKVGKKVRMSFSKIEEPIQMPDLLEVQKGSYRWFMEKGIQEVLEDVSPIVDYSGNLFIDFVPHAPSPSAGRSLQRFDIPYRGQA